MSNELKASPRVLAVLVTHNGRPWLSECLESLAAQDYPALDIVVVDNGSSNPVEPVVRRLLPRAEFLRLERNVGFGLAANAALEYSSEAPAADYYLFLHDDAAFDGDCVAMLVLAAVETEAGIVGGKGVGWEQPEMLIEVGMTADQLGYSFSGLEEGEIDQGQHDLRREVLFVSSACMLISRRLIERCGLWDGAYFAFGEDVDLCIRGRIAGFKVIVQPAARYRHAVALANEARESKEVHSIRFFTRRNRLRLMAKTVAAYRVVPLLLLYGALVFGEILVLLALRKFQDLPDYPKALGSFFVSLPDTIRRRRAVQKRRAIPDRGIRRFMVRDLHRARIFAERRFRQWEVGTLQLGSKTLSRLSPANLKVTIRAWARKPATIASALLIGILIFAMRKSLGGDPLASGGLWPFPPETGKLMGEYFSAWRDVGLGTSAAAPPALPLLWSAALISLGKADLAQRVVLAGLIAIGLTGIWRFVSVRTTAGWARVAAVALYALGPVTKSIVETADLGAMALYAGVPFLLEISTRMLSASPGRDVDRPPTPLAVDPMTRDSLKLAVIGAAVVALAPSGFLVLLVLMLLAGGHTLAVSWDRRETLQRIRWLFGSLAASLVLLLPWTFEAMRPKGPILSPLFSGPGGGLVFRPLWEGSGFTDMFFLSPQSGWPARTVAAAAILGGLVLARARRRREGRLLAVVWIGFAVLGGAVAKGWLPAPVPSAAMWMVVPLVAMSVLGANFVSALTEELPRHVMGWRHAVSGVLLAVLLGGSVVGWGMQIGKWARPRPTLGAPVGELGKSLSSFFITNAEQFGDYRVLWLGERWIDPIRSGSRRIDQIPYFVTGPGGLSILSIQDSSPAAGEDRLSEIVDALLGRRLHHAGHLLAPASIRYLVVDTRDDPTMAAMARQQDIALEHQQSGVAVFRNIQWLPRVALAPPGLIEVAAAKVYDERRLMQAEWIGGRNIPPMSRASYGMELPRTYYPAVLVGDNYHPGWRAWVAGVELRHAEAFGFSNRFDLPAGAAGELRVFYGRRWTRGLWLVLQTFVVGMALAMIRVKPTYLRERLT